MSASTLRLSLLLLVLMALLTYFSGCGTDEEFTTVDFSKQSDLLLPTQKKAITYAYLPQYSHAVSYGRHHLLIEYLSQETGLPFRQVYPNTFDEHVKMVERGDIDISFSNPFIYLQLAAIGARAFARIVEPSGKPDFAGEIITRSDGKIKTLKDCKAKRWIAVDRSSAGGYLFPLGLFLDNGLRRKDFQAVDFAPGPGGKQEKVVLAVYAGAYDIGSIRQGTLNILKNKIDLNRIRILATTRAYPSWVYALRKDFPVDQAKSIAKAMFQLNMKVPHDAVILTAAGIRGIIPATDSDYAPVRELVKRIRNSEGGAKP